MWTDLAAVKRFLAIAPADVTDDDVIQDSLDAAQHLAFSLRASSGYTDSPVTSPNAGATAGVTRWAALLYQARGTGEGFAGFIDTGAVIGTPYYESRRMILMLLGVPRPTVDGTPGAVPPAGYEYVRYETDGSVQLAPAPYVTVPQGTEPDHAARLSDVATALPPFYFGKAKDVLNVGDVYVPIVNLLIGEVPGGVYMFGIAVSYTYDTTTRSVYIRWRTGPLNAWNEFVHEPGDTTDVVPLVYTFPTNWATGPLAFELEMHKESGGGGGTLNVLYADVWAGRVG